MPHEHDQPASDCLPRLGFYRLAVCLAAVSSL
jgi:hypothetical protein